MANRQADRSRGLVPVALALAAPILVATVLLGAIAVAESGGGRLFAVPADHPTLAEAAGLSRAADVQRLLRAGVDPNARYPVPRATVGNDQPLEITPLEAAVMRGDLIMVQLLEQRGARRDAAMTARLRALATSTGATDILEYLNR